MTRVRVATNVYRDAYGIAARVYCRGETRERRFLKGTPLERIKAWQADVTGTLRATVPARRHGSLADDITRYLKAVATMPSIRDRTRHLMRWQAALGPDRDLASVTAVEVRAHLARWEQEGYAASTRNHFRTALMHLWTTTFGKARPCPLRDVPKALEPDPLPHAIPYATVLAVVNGCRPSASRARLRVFATTGLPPAQMARLRPEDVQDGLLWVTRRRKGRGVQGSVRPITPDAQAALAEMASQNAFGPFAVGALRKVFQRACKRQGVTGVRLYDLRHAFLTDVFAATHGSSKAVQLLAGHATEAMGARYALAAIPAFLQDAVAKVQRFREESVTEKRDSLPVEPVIH